MWHLYGFSRVSGSDLNQSYAIGCGGMGEVMRTRAFVPFEMLGLAEDAITPCALFTVMIHYKELEGFNY